MARKTVANYTSIQFFERALNSKNIIEWQAYRSAGGNVNIVAVIEDDEEFAETDKEETGTGE